MSWGNSTTQSHQDFFARNIITCRSCGGCGCNSCLTGGDTDEFDEEFSPGGALCPWPLAEDVVSWCLSNGYAPKAGQDTSKSPALAMAVAGARQMMARDLGISLADLEAPVLDAEEYVHTVMQAAWLYFAKDSPTGVAGTDDINGAIRAGSMDPRVRQFLSQAAPMTVG